MILGLDFETRSATDIKDGIERYVADPRFGVMMLAFELPDRDGPVVWHRGPTLAEPEVNRDALEQLFDHIRAGGIVSGWSSGAFEWRIWNQHCVPLLGWPELPIEQVVDTMAQAAAMNLPQGLGRCAEVLGLPDDQQKSKRGKYLIQRLCKPHKPTKTRSGVWVEDPQLFEEFVQYCAQDVVAEKAVARKLRPLTEQQRKTWLFTHKINQRGVPVAVDECRLIERVVEIEKARLNDELFWLTSGLVDVATRRKALLDWCNARMAETGRMDSIDLEDPVEDEIENLKAATVDAMLKLDLPDDVRRALEIRAAVVQTSTAKYGTMIRVAGQGGRMRGLYIYHGAGTGRWACRTYNAQNISSPTIEAQDIETAFEVLSGARSAEDLHRAWLMLFGDQVMDVAVSLLRGMIKADEGNRLIDVDFSNVEVRVGAWLAGQEELLQAFREGVDPYKVLATQIFKVRYEDVTPSQRKFCKPPVLGGIFGLGGPGLVDYADSMGVAMTLTEAKEAIAALRGMWRLIPKTWYACGDASVDAVRNPGQWFQAGPKLSLICHKNYLWMKLPSGRLLAWAAPVVELRDAPWTEKVFVGLDENGKAVIEERPAKKQVVTVESIETKTRQWCRHPLIGSSIYQSGVQATAADILDEGAQAAEERGYPVVMLTHDEVTAHAPVGWGSVEELGNILIEPRPWREDLPLAFEGWEAPRFKK